MSYSLYDLLLEPPKARFYHLFQSRCYPNFLSIAAIPNPIFCSLSIHQTQYPHFHNIRLFTAHLSISYNITDHIVVQKNSPLSLSDNFLSQITPKTLFYSIHLAWIQWFTSTISHPICMMDPRYLNGVTYTMVGSPIFTSKFKLAPLAYFLNKYEINSII